MSIGLEICRELRSRIDRGMIVDQLPSISELMKEFNVSFGTVKLALERLKMQKVIYGMHGKGTFVNTCYRPDTCRRILVRLAVWLLQHPFYIRIINALEAQLAAVNLELELSSHPVSNPAGRRVVIALEESLAEEEVALLYNSLEPVTLIAINAEYSQGVTVACGNRQGGHEVMEALYRRGHRNFGLLTKSLHEKRSFFHDRAAGVKDFQQEHPEVRIVEVEMLNDAEPAAAAAELRRVAPDVTAVFAFTDVLAVEVLRRFDNTVAVVGYGNSGFCELQQPALASMDEQPLLVADKLMEAVMTSYSGGIPQPRILIAPKLVERASIEIGAMATSRY